MTTTSTRTWQETQDARRHDASAKLSQIAQKVARNVLSQEVHFGEDDGTLCCGGKVTLGKVRVKVEETKRGGGM
jgi:hypothetical protein